MKVRGAEPRYRRSISGSSSFSMKSMNRANPMNGAGRPHFTHGMVADLIAKRGAYYEMARHQLQIDETEPALPLKSP